ncbi:alcohol dehydrogenase catalytic domain-containing protein, partial [Streptomyces sp. NPDC090442]|uniref:SpnB-like Rossmann fold domain-containing protein n=1 Tax=Streptomyces sp. NPDC090442 TaxID=3365962 RepID=UPI003820EF75
ALHAALLTDDGNTGLPFAWEGATLHATGATALRVRLTPTGDEGRSVALAVADTAGRPVATIDQLVSRPVSGAQLTGATSLARDALFALDWTPVPEAESATAADGGHGAPTTLALIGTTAIDAELAADLAAAGVRVTTHSDLSALAADDTDVPDTVLIALGETKAADATSDTPSPSPAEAAHTLAADALALVQQWTEQGRSTGAARLAFVTTGAVAAGGTDITDLAASAVWGLVRSAQSEAPDTFVLIDRDPRPAGPHDRTAAAERGRLLLRALHTAEPQLALRDGGVLAGRLTRVDADAVLAPPADPAWRLDSTAKGSLNGLVLTPYPAALEPLTGHQVRVEVRAAGLNFRDVLNALGMYPGDDVGLFGSEAAGVVVEVGPEVTGLAPGDRVMGMITGSFGSLAVDDARRLTHLPEDWSWERGAAVPLVFLTAYYALRELGGLRAG